MVVWNGRPLIDDKCSNSDLRGEAQMNLVLACGLNPEEFVLIGAGFCGIVFVLSLVGAALHAVIQQARGH